MIVSLDIEHEQKLSRECSENVIKKYKNSDTPITCKKGCNDCCKLNLSCYPNEASTLAEKVLSGEVEIDKERLKRWKSGSRTEEDMTCVFLDSKGECSVYDDRPIMCSRMLVSSDPCNCAFGCDKPKMQAIPEKLDQRQKLLARVHGWVNMREALFNHLLINQAI